MHLLLTFFTPSLAKTLATRTISSATSAVSSVSGHVGAYVSKVALAVTCGEELLGGGEGHALLRHAVLAPKVAPEHNVAGTNKTVPKVFGC